MNRTLIYLLLTILLLSCAGARRSTPPQTEIFSLPPVPSQSNVEARTDSITYFTRFFDRQNESQFKIPAGMTGELLRKKLQQTEITVQKLLSDRPDTLFLLAFDEWCFFALIGLQDLFKEEFNRPSHSYDADGGILFTFDKDVSGLLPYIQENRRICREKTQLVYNVLDVLDRPLNAEKQSRGLLALTRMLEKIDIKKSESGYEPFQRSAEGLYLTPGVLASRVENIFSRMSENQVLEKAKELKGNIQKQLSKPLDRAFVEKMQTSKELLYLAEKEKNLPAGSGKKSNRKEIFQSLTAYNWFEKANSTPDMHEKIDFYTKAIQLDSGFVAAYNNRGNTYLDLGLTDAALKDYRQAVELDKNFYLGYFNIGNIYQSQRQEKNAIDFYDKAIQKGPLYARSYIHRGQSWSRLKRNDHAVTDYRKALELDSTLTSAWSLLGVSYLEMEQYENAMQIYNKAISREAENPVYYNHRGVVFQKLGQNEQAMVDFQRAIELDSTYALAWHNLGRIHQENKRYNSAIKNMKRAIELSPDNPLFYYNLGRAYWSKRSWTDVVAAWEKCRELDPEFGNIDGWLVEARRRAR